MSWSEIIQFRFNFTNRIWMLIYFGLLPSHEVDPCMLEHYGKISSAICLNPFNTGTYMNFLSLRDSDCGMCFYWTFFYLPCHNKLLCTTSKDWNKYLCSYIYSTNKYFVKCWNIFQYVYRNKITTLIHYNGLYYIYCSFFI